MTITRRIRLSIHAKLERACVKVCTNYQKGVPIPWWFLKASKLEKIFRVKPKWKIIQKNYHWEDGRIVTDGP